MQTLLRSSLVSVLARPTSGWCRFPVYGIGICLAATSALGQFGDYQELTDTVLVPRAIRCADMDGDGDLDVFVLSGDAGEVLAFENLGGGAFGPKRIIDGSADRPEDQQVVDLDGDGNVDIVACSSGDSLVRWYSGAGDGTFGSGQVATASLQTPVAVDTADFDGDGNVDLLIGSLVDGLSWQPRQGAGYGAPVPIGSPGGILEVSVGDLDGDLLPDFAFSTDGGQTVGWHRNLGGGSFAAEATLVTGAQNCSDIQPADLDGDGDLDLVLVVGSSPNFGWVENLGGGAFAAYAGFQGSGFSPREAAVLDFDGDGDLDVVGSSTFDLFWYSNLGSGVFASAEILGFQLRPTVLRACDITGDGTADLVTGNGNGTMSLYEGVGAPNLIEPLAEIGVGAFFSSDIASGDLDGDGDLDVVSASTGDDKISVYENLGGGAFGPQTALVVPDSGVFRTRIADLDGDGNMDILVGTILSQELYWYPGDGSGQFGTRLVIDVTASFVQDMEVCDFDRDGDIDFVATIGGSDSIMLYENTGAGSFAAPVLLAGTGDTLGLVLGDVDGIGYDDIFVYDLSVGRIVWYRNLTGFVFAGVANASGLISSASTQDLTLLDFDVDGDLDLVWLEGLSTNGKWAENLGNGNFGPNQSNGVALISGTEIQSADIDGDGDSDVVYAQASFVVRGVYWLENLGGTFGPPQEIRADDGPVIGPPADMDGDGDLDILAASTTGFSVGWFEASILETIGDLYCLPAQQNSTGKPATIFTTGSLTVAEDSLVLRTASLPANKFALYLASPNQDQVPAVGSQGVLCLGSSIGRFTGPGQIQLTGQAGTTALDIGTQAVATPSGIQPIQSGETWNFQLWYRDSNPTTTSNFTSGVSVTFL